MKVLVACGWERGEAEADTFHYSKRHRRGDGRPMDITWDGFRLAVKELAAAIRIGLHTWSFKDGVYGVPTGGCFVAMELRNHINTPLLDTPKPGCLIIDDLVDSGKTMERYKDYAYRAAIFHKEHSPKDAALTAGLAEGWVRFPWENSPAPEDAVVRLLEFIGEDPKRDGLRDTPGRVTRAWQEMTAGYKQDPAEILSRVFDEPYDEIVVLQGCPFASNCEHHMQPFVGTVDIGYLPGKVVGLSKLARLVECFSLRLQVQERLTKQIAEALQTHLDARGVAVVVRASHSCMACRGVRKPGATMITSAMLGAFREKAEVRAEFMALVS